MDFNISQDSLASIIALIAPGYFAIQIYSAIYAKQQKDFSRLLLESVVYGLLIASIYKVIWRSFSSEPVNVLSFHFYFPLLIFAVILGALTSFVRQNKYVRRLTAKLDLPDADDDFIRTQFKKLPNDATVTVTLKNGKIFSATPATWSTNANQPSQKLTFTNLAWFDKRKRKTHWDERPGSLIVAVEDILYIETDTPLSK
jgi:hypothetical protein